MQRNSIENVCFPMEIAGIKRAEARKRAEELLNLVNLSDKIKSYPSKLSGGQRQRVAIARAIAMEPAALLCDEPTSALDPETTGDILSLLKDLNARLGITIVIITHEARVVEAICDRVAAIENGKIIGVNSLGRGL
jgi:D-methionine transport system ATP-binding protein